MIQLYVHRGFRRVTRGPDRDSYYHEVCVKYHLILIMKIHLISYFYIFSHQFFCIYYYLKLFLRGRPDLHPRMKRLGASYRKTPVQKDSSPDFFELSKRNPLPGVEFHRSIAPPLPTSSFTRPSMAQAQVYPQAVAQAQVYPHAAAPSNVNLGGHRLDMSPYSQSQMPRGMPGGGSLGGGGGSGSINLSEQVSSLFRNDVARSSTAQSSLGDLGRISQLQRDNEDLKRRIAEMEVEHRMKREIIMQQMGASGSVAAAAPGYMNPRDEMLLRAYNNVGQAQPSSGSSHPSASLDDDQRKALADMLSKQQRHDST